jgi:hypothetical protein
VLIYSMSVSVDGYLADRDGGFGWSAPSDELFAFHLARARELGAHLCGRRLYETMLPWETDPSLRDTELLVGGGAPYLPPAVGETPPDLIETRTFGSRVIYERYQRVQADSG